VGLTSRRARRHLLVAGFVLAYLAAGGVIQALGDRVVGGGWLALHLVLLGAATNAIVVWSEPSRPPCCGRRRSRSGLRQPGRWR
jgi:nitrite reductase (NO-forming)